MLEQASLLVQAWMQAPNGGGGALWTRSISDADQKPLGFARLDRHTRSTWLPWFRKLRIDVFETEDASHLMSVSRLFAMSRAWVVDDAEDRRIGSIHAKLLLSSEGGTVASVQVESAHRVRLLDGANQFVATAQKHGALVELTFAPPPHPFVRMLVLGWVLSLEPLPA